jgi:hypothetical protein
MRIKQTALVEQGWAQPETVAALLRELHLQNVSVQRQADALGAWLGGNIPSGTLRLSLRRTGYGRLLDQIFRRPARRNGASCDAQPPPPPEPSTTEDSCAPRYFWEIAYS